MPNLWPSSLLAPTGALIVKSARKVLVNARKCKVNVGNTMPYDGKLKSNNWPHSLPPSSLEQQCSSSANFFLEQQFVADRRRVCDNLPDHTNALPMHCGKVHTSTKYTSTTSVTKYTSTTSVTSVTKFTSTTSVKKYTSTTS